MKRMIRASIGSEGIRKVLVHARPGYTKYGLNSPGYVYLEEYLNRLRKYYTKSNYADGRYVVSTIKAYWSGDDTEVITFDNIDEAIHYAADYLKAAEESFNSNKSENDCVYYANVIDSIKGEEIYWDEVEERTSFVEEYAKGMDKIYRGNKLI